LTSKKTAWKTCLKELLWFSDLETYEFVYMVGNCHIYEEHFDALKGQLLMQNELHPFQLLKLVALMKILMIIK